MAGVFTSRPALDLLWGYEDTLLQLLVTLLPPGSLADGSKVWDMGLDGGWIDWMHFLWRHSSPLPQM